MSSSPVHQPSDGELLQVFVRHFHLSTDRPPIDLLRRVATAFARLPYENLTKIIKDDEIGRADRARRTPAEVIADHQSLGAGGTCFSLTATLLHLVRCLDWRAEPILADRSYGQNTHCALVVWIDDRPHLIDPGYLIVDPIPLDTGGRETTVQTAFNELVLKPLGESDRLDLSTVQQGDRRQRLTFKTQPADAGEFLRAWDASFDWDMMRHPLLTRVVGDRQLYLNGTRFQVRSHQDVRREDLSADELTIRIAREFGIRPEVVRRALSILKRKGESHGSAPTG